ncbi:MAG: hypothetical protein JWO13_3094 [Acidobacteriales bacterium]|nr:hypothetical protein [Terriglobales bacterium]
MDKSIGRHLKPSLKICGDLENPAADLFKVWLMSPHLKQFGCSTLVPIKRNLSGVLNELEI